MNVTDKNKFMGHIFNKVFDCVCILSDRYCEEKGIVPPTPEDADAYDRYCDYLNNVTATAITKIMYKYRDMTYEEATEAFDNEPIDEFIDLNSAQF